MRKKLPRKETGLFLKTVKSITNGSQISKKLYDKLPDDLKAFLIYYTLRYRLPVHEFFIRDEKDLNQAHACGYLYDSIVNKQRFLNTIENLPKSDLNKLWEMNCHVR